MIGSVTDFLSSDTGLAILAFLGVAALGKILGRVIDVDNWEPSDRTLDVIMWTAVVVLAPIAVALAIFALIIEWQALSAITEGLYRGGFRPQDFSKARTWEHPSTYVGLVVLGGVSYAVYRLWEKR